MTGPARLLIHPEPRPARAPWQRLAAWWRPRPPEPVHWTVRIRDLAQRDVATFEDPGSTVLDVALPPGTYHVLASAGPVRRGYTMTLLAGGVFDLHLPSVRRPS